MKTLLISIILLSTTIIFAQGTNTPSCSGGVPNATPLTVSTTCTPVGGTTVGATFQSNNANANTPSCASPGAPDVFFMFTAPASGNITIDLGAGSMTDSGMSLYTGSCGAWTEVDCDDDSGAGTMSQITATGLTPGQTYLIRVWDFNGGSTTGTFTICVQDNSGGGGGVANDDPCTATSVTANSSCVFSTYTNAGATNSGIAPGCANYAGGDVWFSVTVPASGNLIFDTNTGVMTDGGMAIYTGTCASPTLLACNDDGSSNGLMPMIDQPGLTPGSTVWIQVWEFGNNNNGTFQLCVEDPGASGTPANDNPCNATVIPVGASCTFATYTNASATNSGILPGCASYSGGDVWFQVTVPASGALAFDSNTGVITDGGMAIYSGTCGALTLIDCDDDGSTNGAMPYIDNSLLTPGSTIWIQFWEFGNNNNGTFQLCVEELTPPPPPPGNVSCTGMEPICSDTPITFTASTGGNDADITNPGNNYGCLSTSPNPTWYYLQLQTGGNISIDMSAGQDIDFALWGPYPNLATAQANCNAYPAPTDCSYSIASTEQANVTGATAGQVYVLLVTNYADVTQVIDLNSGAGNTALTDCSIILPVSFTNFGLVESEFSNEIKWTTSSELNSDFYIVQKSIDGNNFNDLATIDAAGNSTAAINYSYVDRELYTGVVYYRIKQIDLNGDVKYSTVLSTSRLQDKFSIYPNPVSDVLRVSIPKNMTGDFTFEIVNMNGIIVKETIHVEQNCQTISINSSEKLAPGIYQLVIYNESGELIEKIKFVKTN